MKVNKEVNLNNTYFPIQWTLEVGTTKTTFNADRTQSMSATNGIKDAFSKLDYTYEVDAAEAPANLDTTVVLTWFWDFDNNGAGTYDQQDTELGNLINSGSTEGTKLDFEITLTVTQLD